MAQKKKYDTSKAFSNREIAQFLNNAVVASLRCADENTGANPDISAREKRLKNLRAYTRALVEPLLTHHVDQDYLTYQELVNVLVSAALYVQIQYVMATEKVGYKPSANLVPLGLTGEATVCEKLPEDE